MIILRGYYPEKYTGKDNYIKFLFRDEKVINIFHNWNILNLLHPKFTYLFKYVDVYILYRIKVFFYLFFFKFFKPDKKIVIDSQENLFLVDLVSKFRFKSVSIVFYNFASANQVLNRKDFLRLQQVGKIIVMSKQMKGELLKKTQGILKRKIKVIPYRLKKCVFKVWSKKEVDEFRLKHNLPNRYLLYVGSEQERKNFFTLLQAFEELLKKEENVYLIKIGKDQSRINRKRLINRLKENTKLRSKFILIEECDESELVGYYNCSNIFIFPSLYEGFGIPLVEAMACHVPVIANKIPTSVEICGNAALYLDNPYDFMELKNKILFALKKMNNATYRSLSAARSERFIY